MKQAIDDRVEKGNQSRCRQLHDKMLGVFVDNQAAQLVRFAKHNAQGLEVRTIRKPTAQLDRTVNSPRNEFVGNEFLGIPSVEPYANAAIRIIQTAPNPLTVVVDQVDLFTDARCRGGFDNRIGEYPRMMSRKRTLVLGLEDDLPKWRH